MNKLHKFVREYISLRRQLGYELKGAESRLIRFVFFLKSNNATYITTQLALEFATANPKASPSWQARKLGSIRQFAFYLSTFDPRTEIPPKDLLPFKYHRRPPYVFTDKEICNFLKTFQNNTSERPILAQLYYTFFGLIAVTGMRTGEALILTNDSVDLRRGIITINESKYRKTRKIPIHQSTIKILRQYVRCRNRHVCKPVSNYFFVGISGKKIDKEALYHSFRKACSIAGIGQGAKFPPRVVDFRHFFAIKTLVNCHKKRKNPEIVIPVLSMYLGHENPKHTYWYLTATEELMSLIVQRVDEKFGG
jgi:integrase/recombinase XerD